MILLLLPLQMGFLLRTPCKLHGLSPPMWPLLHLPKLSLGDFLLKQLPNPQAVPPFPLPSPLFHQLSHTVPTGQLKSSKVSQQDIPQISPLPLCQSNTVSLQKTWRCLPPPLQHLSQQLPHLWSNKLSISSQETLHPLLCPPPPLWKALC